MTGVDKSPWSGRLGLYRSAGMSLELGPSGLVRGYVGGGGGPALLFKLK